MILINPGREGLNSRGSGGNRRFQLRTWQTAQEAKRGKWHGIMQPLETLRRHTRERGTKSVGSTRPPHAESPCLLELQGQGQQMQLHRLQYSHLRLSGLLAPAPPESSARRFAPSGLSRSRWCEEP